MIDALVDFTGGYSEIFQLATIESENELFQRMVRAKYRGSHISCGTRPRVTFDGLLNKHAYPVTYVFLGKSEF